MPKKPKRPCAWPGCAKLTDGYYCEEHQKKADSRYNRWGRDKDAARQYNRGWGKIRKAYVDSHPLCEMCLREMRVTPVEHVHHIKPLREGGTNDWSNLMSVCHSCHSKIHAERGDYWR